MSRFGKIEKTKLKNKVVQETVYVKSWRAKLAERLLSKDIDELERLVKHRLKDSYYSDVKVEAEKLVTKWWKNYQYQLDGELLGIFPDYEPFLNFQEYKEGDTVADLTGGRYKEVRINGQWLAFIPRFKKRVPKKGEPKSTEKTK